VSQNQKKSVKIQEFFSHKSTPKTWFRNEIHSDLMPEASLT